MAQKYTWGWISRFQNGEVYEEGEGYLSKAAVLQDVQRMRQEEKDSVENGFQTKDLVVKYTVRRQPVYEIPPWEEVSG